MCLQKLDDFEPCKVGYKAMRLRGKKSLYGEYFYDRRILRNVWLHEEDHRDEFSKGREHIAGVCHAVKYPHGFHVFHDKDDALRWIKFDDTLICIRVLVKEPVAVGHQATQGKVTVAKQIKVVETVHT